MWNEYVNSLLYLGYENNCPEYKMNELLCAVVQGFEMWEKYSVK